MSSEDQRQLAKEAAARIADKLAQYTFLTGTPNVSKPEIVSQQLLMNGDYARPQIAIFHDTSEEARSLLDYVLTGQALVYHSGTRETASLRDFHDDMTSTCGLQNTDYAIALTPDVDLTAVEQRIDALVTQAQRDPAATKEQVEAPKRQARLELQRHQVGQWQGKAAAHLNHLLQGSSDQERAEAVAGLASSMGITRRQLDAAMGIIERNTPSKTAVA
jgi:hypothetical protein